MLAGRLLLLTGVAVVLGFQLFTLTDHAGLTPEQAQPVLVVAGILIGVCTLISTVVFGLVSDRVRRRKVPVLVAALLLAVAAAIPILMPTTTGFLVFVAIAAFGYGGYQAVDTALMTEVLPSPADRARDLGILNLANAGGQALGPALVPLVLGAAGGYSAVFALTAVVALLAALAVLPVRSAA